MGTRKIRNLGKYLKNTNIEKITDSNIRFTKEFKIKALKLFSSGTPAKEIFIAAGIDVTDFEKDYAKKSIGRWSKAARVHGASKLNEERRGLRASGRSSSGKKFKSQSEELIYLRAENDFLKKIRALGSEYSKKKNIK